MRSKSSITSFGILKLIISIGLFLLMPVLFIFTAATANAYDVVLAWMPNEDSDLAGYKIYGREIFPGPPYDLVNNLSLDDIDTDYPTCRITDLYDSRRYYFVISAYDLEGLESVYSNEVCVAGGLPCGIHTITASAVEHGSISPQGLVHVDNGSSQSFTITPNANYHVNDLVVDGISVGAVTSYTFYNIATNHTISASFAKDDDFPWELFYPAFIKKIE